MKRLILAIVTLLFSPGILTAAGPATLGVFFDQYVPRQMTYEPAIFTTFKAYLYLVKGQCSRHRRRVHARRP
jgi:hypothetical protein